MGRTDMPRRMADHISANGHTSRTDTLTRPRLMNHPPTVPSESVEFQRCLGAVGSL